MSVRCKLVMDFWKKPRIWYRKITVWFYLILLFSCEVLIIAPSGAQKKLPTSQNQNHPWSLFKSNQFWQSTFGFAIDIFHMIFPCIYSCYITQSFQCINWFEKVWQIISRNYSRKNYSAGTLSVECWQFAQFWNLADCYRIDLRLC